MGGWVEVGKGRGDMRTSVGVSTTENNNWESVFLLKCVSWLHTNEFIKYPTLCFILIRKKKNMHKRAVFGFGGPWTSYFPLTPSKVSGNHGTLMPVETLVPWRVCGHQMHTIKALKLCCAPCCTCFTLAGEHPYISSYPFLPAFAGRK